MKIAIETSPLSSGHRVRGVGQYTRRLLEALNQSDHANTYLTFTGGTPPPEAEVVHYPFFHPYFLTLPTRFAKPTVVTVHDLIPLVFPVVYPPGLRGRARFYLQAHRLRRAAAIVTDSQASSSDVERYYGLKDNVRTVYLAAGDEFEVLARSSGKLGRVRRKFGLPKTFVLYVGDVNYNKDVPRLVQACWEAKLPLVIAGKYAASDDFDPAHPENRDLVWLRGEVKKAAKLPSGELSVRTLGFVSDSELVCLYNLASVYCQPSRYEGFGLTVLEAMACGAPVVAAASSSLVEVISTAGVLVSEPGVRSLAEALQKVVSDRRLASQLVAKGLGRAARFSWKQTAQEMGKIYEEVGRQNP